MGYQESFIYSKTNNKNNIKSAVNIIKKYKLPEFMNISYAEVPTLKPFSNGHKKKYPILDWPKDTNLIMTFGERYDQHSISRAFSIDHYTRYNLEGKEKDEDSDFLISYTEDEYKILDDLDIVFIDDYIDPKLKGEFTDYFGDPSFINIIND